MRYDDTKYEIRYTKTWPLLPYEMAFINANGLYAYELCSIMIMFKIRTKNEMAFNG